MVMRHTMTLLDSSFSFNVGIDSTSRYYVVLFIGDSNEKLE